MAIPAVHKLHLDGYDIQWLCGQSVFPLLSCYAWITPIKVNDKALLRGTFPERVRTILAIWKKIAFEAYDLCAVLYYDPRYRILALPVRASRKIFFSEKSRQSSMVPTRHQSSEYLRILLGEHDGYKEGSALPVRPDHLPVSPIPPKSKDRRIAIVPGGAGQLVRGQARSGQSDIPSEPAAVRRWPIASYRALAQVFVERGWEVVLLGGPEDDWAKVHFSDLQMIDCIGHLSLPQVISVMDGCDAVISHDTGPLHLAALSTTSLVGIFGPTPPSTFLPRRPDCIGIWGGANLACRPCYDGRDFAPCEFNGCMHQVTPALVLAELENLLFRRTQGKPAEWRVVEVSGPFRMQSQ